MARLVCYPHPHRHRHREARGQDRIRTRHEAVYQVVTRVVVVWVRCPCLHSPHPAARSGFGWPAGTFWLPLCPIPGWAGCFKRRRSERGEVLTSAPAWVACMWVAWACGRGRLLRVRQGPGSWPVPVPDEGKYGDARQNHRLRKACLDLWSRLFVCSPACTLREVPVRGQAEFEVPGGVARGADVFGKRARLDPGSTSS